MSTWSRLLGPLSPRGETIANLVFLRRVRYMAWVEENLEITQPVRGIIVAYEIMDDLKLAASRVPDIRLIEYKISFELHPV
jgi:hypothetical protein